MFLEIKDFLTPQAVARLGAIAAQMRFVDGRVSNPANESKANLQASNADPLYAESVAIVGDCLCQFRTVPRVCLTPSCRAAAARPL